MRCESVDGACKQQERESHCSGRGSSGLYTMTYSKSHHDCGCVFGLISEREKAFVCVGGGGRGGEGGREEKIWASIGRSIECFPLLLL